MSTLASRMASLSPQQRELLARQLARRKKEEAEQAQIHPFARQDNVVALSFAQRRFWLLERLTPGNPVYNMSGVARVVFPLQLPRLQHCFQQIVRRHETLRMSFEMRAGEPVGIVSQAQPLTIEVIDLQSVPQEQREERARTLIEQEARRPFDLSHGPLLRISVLQLGEQEYLVQVSMHHIVGDGWSTRVLFQEIGALYFAEPAHQAAALPELPFQYADFARWQQQWVQGERRDHLLSYWKQHLAGCEPVLELPTDRPRPAVQSYQGAREAVSLDPELVQELKALSQQHGATLFMTLLAAFEILLARYSRQEQVLVGVPIANRTRAGTEALIGVFVNTLVLRADLAGDPSVVQFLEQVRQRTLDAYRQQDLPFEMLVEELHLQRDLSRTPLIQTLFNFQVDATSAVQMPGLTLEDIGSGTAKVDLALNLEEHERGVSGHLEYSSDLFEAETMQRLLAHYQVLLRGMVAHPEQSVARLPLLTERERQQVLVEWNATQTPYPQQCVHQLFEQQARMSPDALALLFAGEYLTYRELNQRANQLAHYLRKQGVGPDVLVGVCMERSLEMIVVLLGILKAGGAYVPLDPSYPRERLAYMLDDAQVPILLTLSHLLERLPAHITHTVCMDNEWGIIAHEETNDLAVTTTLDNLAIIIYTSGSTGLPKGVEILHRGIVRMVKETHYADFSSEGVFLQFGPISFDVSVFEIWGSLLNGAQLVIFPPRIPTLDELATFLDRHHISTLWLTAGLFHQMAERHAQTLGRIHQVLAGGDVLSVPHVRRVLEVIQEGCTFIAGYGPTENSTFTTCYPMRTLDDLGFSTSIGKAIANTTVYVLDKNLLPVPIGVPGELYTGGDGLARGYHQRPELTAEKFIPDPFSDEPGARLYKTGDLVRYLPDGNLEFLQRLDNQVKLRGFRIELGEIETVLKQCPQVQDAVVVAREDNMGDKRLVAYLVLQSPLSSMYENLRAFLRERLPEYMLPASFVELDALPLTPNGKVDRRALPAPQSICEEQERPIVAPSTPIEQALVEIWRQLLGVEPISVDDDFFEIGGHSLLAMKLIAHMQDTLHVEIPLPVLFQYPTVGEMAQIVEALQQDGPTALDRWQHPLDLQAEAVLDPTIQFDAQLPLTKSAQARRLLLTGATGFLGAFLLERLLRHTPAELYCLVRAATPQEGMERLQRNLQEYGLWDEQWRARIIAVPGDLSQPLLGLSPQDFERLAQRVEVIYHNGALVHFVRAYDALKATNVLGTQEVVRLASQGRTKAVHYISSTYVFSRAEYGPDTLLYEDDQPLHTTRYTLGYTQSKWVAEHLLYEARRRGLPVSIYRIGRVGGHSQTGACQLNDLLWKFIQASVLVGAAPQFDLTVELSPVDYVSQALVHLSRQEKMQGQNFHLVNQQYLRSQELVEWMRPYGYQMQLEPYAQWCQRVLRFAQQYPESPAAGLAPLLSGALPLDQLPNLLMDESHTNEGLAGSGIVCPPMTAQLMTTYFAYFIRRGYFDAPRCLE